MHLVGDIQVEERVNIDVFFSKSVKLSLQFAEFLKRIHFQKCWCT